ncbi:DUF29 domain-containing protein [Endozoicomonas sp. ONNA1]|uniref:DUF29 domain-containing protein n=1 Tax=Endozoicomonas sp. ONNA1 TaxID=2828740 RepID=UPI0021483A7A|nr:DUF29 domain-containing protein [Endozoicomonas sp. ONNA1]
MKNNLYDSDYYSWTCQQAKLLKEGKLNELDIENLIEEVETMGKSQYRTLKSCIEQLLLHLLKWRMQSQKKNDLHDMELWYRSWKTSIVKQRLDIKDELDENQTLINKLDDIIPIAYGRARLLAAKAMDCNIKDFPDTCPWTFDQIMIENWYPE